MADSLILMVLALVVFGPRRLPQIGRQIGKLMYEFRKASNDFKFQMEEELRNSEEADRRKKEEERLRALALNAPPPASPASETVTAEPETTSAGSPYPWESVYPAISTPTVEAQVEVPAAAQTEVPAAVEPSDEAPAAEAPLAASETEATPKPSRKRKLAVQPPSTGETVPATPPRRTRAKKAVSAAATEEVAAPADPHLHVLAAENMPPLSQSPAVPEEAPAPEQVPHG